MEQFENVCFRCDRNEKQRFMRECEQIEISGSGMLRRFIHLFLNDRTFRTAALNLNDKHYYLEEF